MLRTLRRLLLGAALALAAIVGASTATAQDTSDPRGAANDHDVVLDTGTGTLYGALRVPDGDGPWTVALIHAGSGPTDRNGNSAALPGRNDSLLLLADALAARGVASLRYDKRGIAASMGAATSEADLRFDTYVDDAVRWLEQLGADARFDARVVIGHSEGALIGMLAAERVQADAYVSLAGPGQNAADLLLEQLAGQLPPTLYDQAAATIERLRAGDLAPDAPPELVTLFRASVQPYLISWFAYDPTEAIARLDMPVLIVQGLTDIQVSVRDAERLAAAAPDADVVLVPEMNHVLKRVPTTAPDPVASYSDPSLPLAPGFVPAIAGFLREHGLAPPAD